jgi:hypothetical protein
MNTIDILLVIIAIYILYILYTDYRLEYNSNLEKFDEDLQVEKLSGEKLSNENTTIESINNVDIIGYYPIKFILILPSLSYIPDECLPLHIYYNSKNNKFSLRGSGQIVATDETLNSITSTSLINIDLILSKSDKTTHDISLSNIEFEIRECNGNKSIVITNLSTELTSLSESYDSITGSIIVGLHSFLLSPIIFKSSTTISDIQNSICFSKSCKTNTLNINNSKLSPIIPRKLNAIDELINDKKLFALYTFINNSKVYLSVSFLSDQLTTGIVKFTNKLTKGSIFNASSVVKFIPLIDIPYKYLDFDNA